MHILIYFPGKSFLNLADLYFHLSMPHLKIILNGFYFKVSKNKIKQENQSIKNKEITAGKKQAQVTSSNC